MQQQLVTAIPKAWSSGLCDCFSDFPNCCLTCFCPCVTFGRIAEIVDQGSTSCGASGALYCLLQSITGCACIYSCIYRSKMKKMYNLGADVPIGDFCIHFCCEPCALCQEHRHLKNLGFDMALGWHGSMAKQNYGTQMAAPTAPLMQKQ